ncbi:MAG: LPS export ABC transporter periplasmic protein LptC [Candidatus Binataceae bacterium]
MSPRRIAKALAVFGSIALATILIVAVWVVRHRSTVPTLKAAAGLVPGVLLHAHNFHWTQMKGDQSQWVLTAKDASYSADKTSLVLKDAEVSMIGKDGKKTVLDAPEADLKLDGNHISRADLHGGIKIDYGDFVLTTQDATFLPDTDVVQAPGFVKVVGKEMTVTGVGLTGHPKAQVFQLLSQVTTHIEPRQNGESKAL